MIKAGDKVRISKKVREELGLEDKKYVVKIVGRSFVPAMKAVVVKGVGKAIPLDEVKKAR